MKVIYYCTHVKSSSWYDLLNWWTWQLTGNHLYFSHELSENELPVLIPNRFILVDHWFLFSTSNNQIFKYSILFSSLTGLTKSNIPVERLFFFYCPQDLDPVHTLNFSFLSIFLKNYITFNECKNGPKHNIVHTCLSTNQLKK